MKYIITFLILLIPSLILTHELNLIELPESISSKLLVLWLAVSVLDIVTEIVNGLNYLGNKILGKEIKSHNKWHLNFFIFIYGLSYILTLVIGDVSLIVIVHIKWLIVLFFTFFEPKSNSK